MEIYHHYELDGLVGLNGDFDLAGHLGFYRDELEVRKGYINLDYETKKSNEYTIRKLELSIQYLEGKL